MKVVFEFDLPADQKDLAVNSKAQEMFYALKELDQWLKKKKAGEYSDATIDNISWTQNEFYEILDSFDIANLVLRGSLHKVDG